MKPIRLLPCLALALGCAVLPAAAGAAADGSDEIRLAPAQVAALGIATEAVVAARSDELQGLPALVVVPNDQLRVVSAPLAGLVEQILVATQQSVRRGQRLARLQSSGLADMQHTFLQAATQLELAGAELERDEQLLQAGVIPARRLQATRAHWLEASADYAERTQALRVAGMSDQAIAELRAGRRVGTSIDLVAPIDGVVLEQLAVVGQRVEAATAMLRVGRLDPLWLELQIPVAKLAAVRDGATVRVAAADAQARVIAIGRNINAANQTVPVRAVTTRGAERLLPGQSVEASLAAAAAGGQWSVPNAALVRSGAAASVFVQSPAGFRRQDVKVVSEGAERSLVAGDLRPGERIAVRGVAALKAAAAGIGVQ